MQLLLLAFAGVRIADPELAAFGLSLPGFAERARRIARLPSLGLLTLAGRAPQGCALAYVERDELPQEVEGAAEHIVEAGFALVAISALSATIEEAYALSRALRRRGVRVVLGGLHVSAVPEEAARHADAVVIGEGEAVFEAVLQDAQSLTLAPRYRASPQDAARAFATGPLPRWDLLGTRSIDRVTVQTERGCSLDCSFCGASRTIAPLRRKALARIAAELEHALPHAPRRRCELADDNSFAVRADAVALVELLGSQGARWFTETDLSLADRPELLERLAANGCLGVLIGLEGARPEHLRGIDSRGRKERWTEQQAERIARIQGAGIPVTGCFVLGLDTQGEEVFEATRRAVLELDLAEVQVTLATPFPGTPWRAELERSGRIGVEDTWSKLTLFDLAFEPLRLSRAALTSGFRSLVSELYAEEATQRRRRRALAIRRRARRDRGEGWTR